MTALHVPLTWHTYIFTSTFSVLIHLFVPWISIGSYLVPGSGCLWSTLLSWGLELSGLNLVLKKGMWSIYCRGETGFQSYPAGQVPCFLAASGLSFGTLTPKPMMAQFLLDYTFYFSLWFVFQWPHAYLRNHTMVPELGSWNTRLLIKGQSCGNKGV